MASRSGKSLNCSKGKTKEGLLLKYNNDQQHPKFEYRFCQISTSGLQIFAATSNNPVKARPKGDAEVHGPDEIKLIEHLDRCQIFKDHRRLYCFQVGASATKRMCFCAESEREREQWVECCREINVAATMKNTMLERFHDGMYDIDARNTWSCCSNGDPDADGCKEATSYGPSETNTNGEWNREEIHRGADHGLEVAYKYSVSSNDSQDSGHEESSQTSRYTTPISLEDTKDEPTIKKKRRQSISSESSGIQDVCETQLTWPKSCFCVYKPFDGHEITLLKFMSAPSQKIALVTSNNLVQLYDISNSAVTHNIQLTHPITSLDVWKHYLLIGSSVVHVVDTREDHWRRIVVVDKDENEPLKGPSQHLAVFNSNGTFATASTRRRNVTLWPEPVENTSLMTEPNETFECDGNICSLCFENQRERLLVIRKSVSTTSEYSIDVIKWSNTETKHLDTINIEAPIDPSTVTISEDGEYIYMIEEQKKEVLELSVRTRDITTISKFAKESIRCIASTCHGTQDQYFIITGFCSGRIEMGDTQSKDPVFRLQLNEEVLGPITSVVYRSDDNVLAVGQENGKLSLWSDSPERVKDLRKQSCEIARLSMYFHGSYSQHSLIIGKFIFEADSRGGIFTNRPSYSLVIPKGAIEEGESLNIQTALINWVGKDCFQFPKNYHVVSPVVWFSANHDVKFKLPLEITLQHCAQDSREILILKAKCSGSSNIFKFEPLGKGNPLGTEYVTYGIDHFCIYCAGVIENHQRRICVIPIEKPYIQNEKEVIFCVCYNLDTCISAVEEQYPNEVENSINTPIPVSLAVNRIQFHYEARNLTVTLKSGSDEVLEDALKFSDKTMDWLRSAHQTRTYPPRVSFALSNESDDLVQFKFRGSSPEQSYEVIPKHFTSASSIEDPPCLIHEVPFPFEEDNPLRRPIFMPFN